MQQSILTVCNFFKGASDKDSKAYEGVPQAEIWTKDDEDDMKVILKWLYENQYEDEGSVARCITAFELGVIYELPALSIRALSHLSSTWMDSGGNDSDDDFVALVELVWGEDLSGKWCDEIVEAIKQTLLADSKVRDLGKKRLEKLGEKLPRFLVDLVLAVR